MSETKSDDEGENFFIALSERPKLPANFQIRVPFLLTRSSDFCSPPPRQLEVAGAISTTEDEGKANAEPLGTVSESFDSPPPPLSVSVLGGVSQSAGSLR